MHDRTAAAIRILAAGAVPLLVECLRSSQPVVQQQTAAALRHLADCSLQNKDAICAAGALSLCQQSA